MLYDNLNPARWVIVPNFHRFRHWGRVTIALARRAFALTDLPQNQEGQEEQGLQLTKIMWVVAFLSIFFGMFMLGIRAYIKDLEVFLVSGLTLVIFGLIVFLAACMLGHNTPEHNIMPAFHFAGAEAGASDHEA